MKNPAKFAGFFYAPILFNLGILCFSACGLPSNFKVRSKGSLTNIRGNRKPFNRVGSS